MPFQVVFVPLAPCAARSARDPTDPARVPAGQRLGQAVWGVGSVCEGVERFEALPKVPQEWGRASGVESDRKNLSQGLAGPVCPVRVGCCALTCRVLSHTSLPAPVSEFMGSQGRPRVFLPPKSPAEAGKAGAV